MEIISQEQIEYLAEQYSYSKVTNYHIENYSETLIGYLGQHLKLIITVEENSKNTILKFFVKCLPTHDKWKSSYLRELNFFGKEYGMLDKLFREFGEGVKKWRPRLLMAKEELFVFEDVAELGYVMPHNEETLEFNQILALMETLAYFHAQSFIFEDKKSKASGRPYRIYEDYKEYLQEPKQGMRWRNVGRNAVIEFLKVYSQYKEETKFVKNIDEVIFGLYDRALELMEPSVKYRNVVVHRDLWTNNILFKEIKNKIHAIIVDFQTVIYCPPMMDVSSAIYMTTTKDFRSKYLDDIINIYYNVLKDSLNDQNINLDYIYTKDKLIESYEETLVFGLTQAALILPTSSMNSKDRHDLFCRPEISYKINEVSRSQEFIDVAKHDFKYCKRITELLDEIVERYILSA